MWGTDCGQGQQEKGARPLQGLLVGQGGQGQGGRGSQTCRLIGTGSCADVEKRLDFLEGLILQGMDADGLLIRAPDGAA